MFTDKINSFIVVTFLAARVRILEKDCTTLTSFGQQAQALVYLRSFFVNSGG